MACIITYNDKKYTQPEFNEYFKSHFFEFAGDFLGSKQDIEGFKNFVNQGPVYYQLPENQVNYQLRIVTALQSDKVRQPKLNNLEGFFNDVQKQGIPSNQLDLLREIISEKQGEFTKEDLIIDLLSEYSFTVKIGVTEDNTRKAAIKRFSNQEGIYYPDNFEELVTVSFYDKDISDKSNLIEALKKIEGTEEEYESGIVESYSIKIPFLEKVSVINNPLLYKLSGGYYYNATENNLISEQEYTELKNKSLADLSKLKEDLSQPISFIPSQYYSNLTVPGGTNYTENEIATPSITPSIKGHAQFSTAQGIGWFRSDEKISEQKKEFSDLLNRNRLEDTDRINELRKTKDLPTKTRRILELQSDLFQKGRDKEILTNLFFNPKRPELGLGKIVSDYRDGTVDVRYKNGFDSEIKKSELIQNDNSENQFLQLLNKDNNWVTFFVRAIIQSTAKERIYEASLPDIEEKVLSLQKEGKLKIDCK